MHHADADDSKSKHPLIHPSIPSSLNSVVDAATDTVPLKVLPLISLFEIILGLISLVETHVCADKPPMCKCLLYRYRGHLFLSSDKLCRNWQDQSSSISSSSPLPWHLQTHISWCSQTSTSSPSKKCCNRFTELCPNTNTLPPHAHLSAIKLWIAEIDFTTYETEHIFCTAVMC